MMTLPFYSVFDLFAALSSGLDFSTLLILFDITWKDILEYIGGFIITMLIGAILSGFEGSDNEPSEEEKEKEKARQEESDRNKFKNGK